jgi:hypothetical protein
MLGRIGDSACNFLRRHSTPQEGQIYLPEYQPAHTALLLNNRVMLEGISIPSELLVRHAPSYDSVGIYRSSLFTVGLGMPSMTDGAFVKAHLRLHNHDNPAIKP